LTEEFSDILEGHINNNIPSVQEPFGIISVQWCGEGCHREVLQYRNLAWNVSRRLAWNFSRSLLGLSRTVDNLCNKTDENQLNEPWEIVWGTGKNAGTAGSLRHRLVE